jgi:lipopolysaccharide export system permease protein
MVFPFILYTYLAAEVLAPTCAAFVILSCVLFLGKIIPLLDILLDFGVGLPDFIRLCAYIAPQLCLFSVPMACMIGIILGLTRLAADGEIMALKASGIGIYRMLPPVFIIALTAAALTGLITVQLLPDSKIAREKLLYQLAKEKIDKGMRARQFSDAIGNIVLYADRIDDDTGEWHGVFVTDMRDQNNPIIVMASHGNLSADLGELLLSLTLKNGSLHRVQGDITQTVRFDRYLLRLSLPNPTGETTSTSDKGKLTLAQLQEQAKNPNIDAEQRTAMLVEYHRRLTLPVGCFILSLIGFPLGLLAGPGRRSAGLPLGLGLFIFYYVLTTAVKTVGKTHILSVVPALWSPNILFALILLYLLHSSARETAAIHLEQAMLFIEKISNRLRRRGADES